MCVCVWGGWWVGVSLSSAYASLYVLLISSYLVIGALGIAPLLSGIPSYHFFCLPFALLVYLVISLSHCLLTVCLLACVSWCSVMFLHVACFHVIFSVLCLSHCACMVHAGISLHSATLLTCLLGLLSFASHCFRAFWSSIHLCTLVPFLVHPSLSTC